ncbi:MAG TPA: AMP-binding protein, partial [Burkholderiaceae bacterium]|nr:AMP-binding protein [Burkholderiaceae bacterium]
MLRPLEVLQLYPPHDGTVASLLDSRAGVAPDRECLVFEQRTITYAKLNARVGRAALLLRQLGVRAGDRVGVMSTNHPSTVATLLALARIGAVMV